MAKQVLIRFEDEEYTLEFTRAAIRQMERQGFVADDIERKPMTMLPMLFEGAFIAHHPTISRSRITKIYDSLRNKSGLIEALAEMYNRPFEALLDDAGEGNAEWASID